MRDLRLAIVYYGLVGNVALLHLSTVSLPAGKSLRFSLYVAMSLDIVTSDKVGHGKSIKRGYLLKKDLFGKVIAQALEKSDDSDSCLIKCMIRKM